MKIIIFLLKKSRLKNTLKNSKKMAKIFQGYYTGIGSRKTPINILKKMAWLAMELEELGFKLRTGNAEGADYAFQRFIEHWNKKIYYPTDATKESIELMLQVHPSPSNAIKYKHVLGRNPLQVLGDNLDKPSKFLVCWTPKGLVIGGTAIAIKIAYMHDIPVFNLYKNEVKEVLKYARSIMVKGNNDKINNNNIIII